MGVTISRSTIIENIYKNFYDLLSTLTSFDVYPAFPDKDISSSSSYPIMILGSPDLSWDNFTIKKKLVSGTITFEVYTADAKTCDQFASDVIDKIEGSLRTLRTYGLRKVQLASTDKEVFQREDFNIHNKTMTFSYEYIFTRDSMPW